MFKDLDIEFNKDYTVLIGINGTGKSSILDALSVAMGAFTGEMSEKAYYMIKNRDARFEAEQMGSRIERNSMYPVDVKCTGFVLDDKPITWKRSLRSNKSRTTRVDAKSILTIANDMYSRSGNSESILPLFASYGTGRLWSQTYSKEYFSPKHWSRHHGYDDCLNSSMNHKQMLKWFQDMTYIGLQENKSIPELDAVESAVTACYKQADTSIKSAKFYYSAKEMSLVMETTRNDKIESLPIDMLSDGEKGIIDMVADIAYRMAVLNPQLLSDVLKTPGVVTIDEIDMHLHPQWQRTIIDDLRTVFPNIQFIVTTHSPSVISNISSEHIRLLNGKQAYKPDTQTFGRDMNDILLDLWGINIRPQKAIDLQKKFDEAIDNNEFNDAEVILHEMKKTMGENSSEVQKNSIALDVERATNDSY